MHNYWNPTVCFGTNRKKIFYVTGETIVGEILLSEVFLSLQTHGPCVLAWLGAPLGQQSLPCALQAAAGSQWSLYLSLEQWFLQLNWADSRAAAFLCCLPHGPSQQSPLGAQKPPSMGNTGLRVSSDRHFHFSSPWTKIDVSRNPDKSLTVSNARNIPYFPFHYEKWFYLDFSEIQHDCSFN